MHPWSPCELLTHSLTHSCCCSPRRLCGRLSSAQPHTPSGSHTTHSTAGDVEHPSLLHAHLLPPLVAVLPSAASPITTLPTPSRASPPPPPTSFFPLCHSSLRHSPQRLQWPSGLGEDDDVRTLRNAAGATAVDTLRYARPRSTVDPLTHNFAIQKCVRRRVSLIPRLHPFSSISTFWKVVPSTLKPVGLVTRSFCSCHRCHPPHSIAQLVEFPAQFFIPSLKT